MSAIVGANRLPQLADNLGAADVALIDDELALLDGVSALSNEYPGWMVDLWSGGRATQLQTVTLTNDQHATLDNVSAPEATFPYPNFAPNVNRMIFGGATVRG